ncbi:SCP2 domain-containing protein [Rhizobiales bacterium RZME27]|uniref:SCP2 domain-containing protein n=1 Tax=Endobacterium cereale TaxID=2663029 RepID=A0A6A8ABG2_9HYPH|nr:SCP2 sterol-binding domain-containing protein [Endobacterium cereale]MEB2844202.1 SCP2 sterol-binding domain-containing protein [Endobacterium cereale]MQY48615.1 SCP2 domain-containing protein [Endobacterium cereale]
MQLIPPLLTRPLGVVPLVVIERICRLMFKRIGTAHPGLFERLGEHKAKRYAFLPTDVPLAFVVEPASETIFVSRKTAELAADAVTEAPLFMLLALMEGRCDADALFFSRDLSVTGDMEAMLAMRNALDASTIDLSKDLARLAGPFAPLAGRVIGEIRNRALGGEATAWN